MKRLHPCRSVTVFAASLLLLSTIVSLGQDDPPLEDQSTPAPESPTVPSDALLGEDLTLPTETLPIGEAAIPKKDRYVIGVVRDGDSWYFDDGVRRWEQELRELAGDSYSIELKDVFNAGNNSNRVGELLRQALDDDSVDMVFAAGVVATERAARLAKTEPTKVTKPIMGGALQFSEIRTQISDTGTSAIPNYTFITSPQRVTADLELLKSLTDANELHVLIEGRLIPELSGLAEARQAQMEVLGTPVRIIASETNAERTLAALPSGVEALYVSLLPGLPLGEREKLYQGLAERKIPVVTMFGKPDVREHGAMAGLAPESADAVARLTALNIHQLLGGALASTLQVYLPVEDYLVINLATAESTGWSSDYDTSLAADFINSKVSEETKTLQLNDALRMAKENNADVLIASEEEAISAEDIRIARSRLLPQADALADHSRTSFSDRIDPLAPDYTHTGSYGAEIRQVLFNDEVFSNVKAQRKLAEATQLETVSVQYDAIEAAAVAYFDYVETEALYKIEKENLRLTNNNLRLANIRITIGAAEPSEAFRWEQNVARDRSILFEREAARSDALVELNRAMGTPRETKWVVEPLILADDEFAFMDDTLKDQLPRRNDFLKFGSFLQLVAVQSSPELMAFDQTLAAQGISLGQKERRYFLPEIAGFASYNRAVSGSEFADTDGEHEGTIGFQLTFPLFEGGRRKAEISRQKAVIRQLAAQREKALQLIEQRALAAAHGIGSTHPGIRLSRRGLQAATKNYASVLEKYSQGTANILALLDAQGSLLNQKQANASAMNSYLRQIHRLQRSISWFEFEKTPEQKERWSRLLKSFLNGELIATSSSIGAYPRSSQAAEARTEADQVVKKSTPTTNKPKRRSLFNKRKR